MPSWWGKSSSKEVKKKANKESFIDTLHRRFKSPSDGKLNGRPGGSRRRCSDTISERGSQSRAESRSPSPSSKHVSRCQSFAERPHAQPLPLPGVHPASVGRTDSGIGISTKPRLENGAKSSLFFPLPRPGCLRDKSNNLDGDLATTSVFSESSTDSEDPADSSHRSPLATDYDLGTRTIAISPSSAMVKDHCATVSQVNSRVAKKPANLSFGNHTSPTSPKRRPISSHVPNLQVPKHGSFCSAPDSYMSSPSRSPMRAFGAEQVINSAFWAGKPYPDVNLLGSGHCSSPGSGYNSGHNSMGGDMSGQLFWQQSRGSPECSPIPSPRVISPGPSSRVQSGAVTPIHPRAGGTIESQTSWPDDGKQQRHRLPLPPVTVSSPSPFSHSNSAAASPSVPRSPGRAENPTSPGSRWKKGKLLGRGTFGHVYLGFNSESGEMCAMKEVTLFSDDAKSKESAKQLMQEISLLSRFQHPNIVQYYGSETDVSPVAAVSSTCETTILDKEVSPVAAVSSTCETTILDKEVSPVAAVSITCEATILDKEASPLAISSTSEITVLDKTDKDQNKTALYTGELSMFDEGTKIDKENNSSIVNLGGSPPISAQLQELSNSLKLLCSSTPSCIDITPKNDAFHNQTSTDIGEPATPSSSMRVTNREITSFCSPWEKFNARSTGMKNSLVQDYLRLLNTADKEELRKLKGIGEKRATYILELREGCPEPFKNLDDLKDIGLSAKQVTRWLKKEVGGLFD
ncbi:hypothetical protein NC652_035629 [Populus alba x Populus x berolinensis]|nr:hypothetical protein NC652_035629 [Populus alba x Populus x berolinensis]